MKQSLGEFISTLRKAQGYTQAEVAEKLNVSNRTLSSWETDRTAPDVAVLPALADIYGVTVDEILRCERQPKNAEEKQLSQAAETAMRKNRFSKFCGKRILCFGLGLLGSAIFVGACALLLYTVSPLWLDILLMILGAGGNCACIILLSFFYYSALRGEGIIFDTDYTEEKCAYATTLRHKFASTFVFNSLPYILGAIIYLIVYFAAGFNNNGIMNIGGITITVDYTTPTAVLVILNCLFGLSMLIFGIAYDKKGIYKFGKEAQRNNLKYNRKLLLKLCGFGAIPIVIMLILFIVLCNVTFESVFEVYFIAHSVDEVYENFQTLTIDEEYKSGFSIGVDENGKDIVEWVTYPKGEYFLNFQSEKHFELTENNRYSTYYDLGNGFYGETVLNSNDGDGPDVYHWEVYRIIDGKSIESALKDDDSSQYLIYYSSYYYIQFEFAGETHYAVNVSQTGLYSYGDYWNSDNVTYDYKFDIVGAYNEEQNEFRYELVCYDKYAPLSVIILAATIGATLITCIVIWCVKHKKNEYKF